jgi:predicted nucleic acid-binding protein
MTTSPKRALIDTDVLIYALFPQLPQYAAASRPFDTLLVATMLGNGVSTIYTYNVGDFTIYPGITVMTP